MSYLVLEEAGEQCQTVQALAPSLRQHGALQTTVSLRRKTNGGN